MSGVADRLRALADAAPPGPWRVVPEVQRQGLFAGADTFVRAADDKTVATGVRSDRVAGLIAFAPELARGYADALDALAELTHYPCTHQAWTPEKLSEVIALCRKCQARAVLAEAGRLLGDTGDTDPPSG